MSSYQEFAVQIARTAGNTLKEYYHNQKFETRSKDATGRNFVTEADIESEQMIVDAIQTEFPGHHVVAEESDVKASEFSGYTWIIDPLDGTTNFSKRLPLFSISIALAQDETPILGVIFDPIHELMFTAEKGKGAYCNGEPVHVSSIESIAHAAIARNINYSNEMRKRDLRDIEKIMLHAGGVRIFYSTALELCYVARGWLDAHVVVDSNPWDIAAGAVIVEEAGGKVTSLSGEVWNLHKPSIIASNGKIHEEIIKLLT